MSSLTAKVLSAVSLNFFSTSATCKVDQVKRFISICVFSVPGSAKGGSSGISHNVGLGVKPGYSVPLHFTPPTAWYDSKTVVTKKLSAGLFC